MSRPPLALLLVSAHAARLRAGLTLARVEIALGGTARLFLQGEAAALMRAPVSDSGDAAWMAAGEPSLAALLDEALGDGVLVSLCQSGLAFAGLDASTLDPRVAVTGPVAFLAAADAETRLLAL